jgi:ribosome-binding ATPase YchF (GTP1/OBG family)
MDVAGLVEGASEGRGLGNQFLDDLRQADVFIQIVDASGETNGEGKPASDYNPVQDVSMLERELDLWYTGILKKIWKAFARTVQNTKENFAKAVAKQFSGLNVSEDDVKFVVTKLGYDPTRPAEWSEEQLMGFSHELRHLTKPMLIAANKIDRPNGKKNLERLKEAYPGIMIMPCSADSELALRQASKAGIIDYVPGGSVFSLRGKLNDKQREALDLIKKDVLDAYGSTGVQGILDAAVFKLLKYLAIFPAGAKLSDSKGNVLPDCFLMPPGSTALDFAYRLHTDIGDKFVKAIDARTKQAVGRDYLLKNRDGLEIMNR